MLSSASEAPKVAPILTGSGLTSQSDQKPALPEFPEAELDWSLTCKDQNCYFYEDDGSIEGSPANTAQLTAVKLPSLNDPQQEISGSLIGRYGESGKDTDANGIRLVVTSHYGSIPLVNGGIFAAGNFNNNAGPGLPVESQNYTANNNTLVIDLTDRWSVVNVFESESETATIAAAIGDEFSSMNGNSLLIRNSCFGNSERGNLLGINTAFALGITNTDEYGQLEKGSMSHNLLVIDSSSILGLGVSENIRIGAVHLVNQNKYGDPLSDVDLDDNRVFIRSSTIDAHSLYAAMIESGPTENQTISSSNNQLVIDHSTITLRGYWDIATIQQGLPAVATSINASNASSNLLYINGVTLFSDYYDIPEDKQLPFVVSSVYEATTALNNTTVITGFLCHVTEEPVQPAPGEKQSFLISGAIATHVGHSDATSGNTAIGNRLYVVGNDQYNLEYNLVMIDSQMHSILSGADILVNESADIEGKASDNLAYIERTDFGKTTIYGGRALGYTNESGKEWQGSADVSNNRVFLQTTVAKDATVIGGHTVRGDSTGNSVMVDTANLTKALLIGGSAEERGTASQNTVTVSASTLGAGSSIYGGYVKTGDAGNTAENNTVILGADVTGTGGSVLQLDALYGGYAQTAVDGANVAYTGNTLYTATRLVTQELGGFQHYQFVATQEQLDAGALIEVTGSKAVVLQADGDQHSTVAIGGTDITFEVGSSYTLIDSAAGFEDLTGQKLTAGTDLSGIKTDMIVESLPSVIRIDKTTFTKDDYDLSIVDGTNGDQSLVIDIAGGGSTSSEINSETDALMESSLSTMTTHFAADDLFVDSVLRSRDGKRDGLFTAARGGKWSYDTRTRIENNIVSGLLGYGAKLSNDLTMGAFIEMGHGSYDTRTHISGSTKAGGGSHNYGGLGVFGDYAMPSFEGLHFTGYLKVGLLRNEFNSNIAGANVDYDRTGVYWGAHLGTHYDWDLTQSIRSRVFLSYFYDGQGDESFDIAGDGDVGGAHVSYDAIHAHRVQLGSMFEFAVSDTWRPYLGLTFEQILAAEAKGTATDAQGSFDLNSSDLEGSTGILSAGWTYQDGNFSTELGLNGYAGTRNGVSGQIQANWKF